MRYGYDLNDPLDRKMYLYKKQKEFERVNNKDLTLSQAYTEYLKESQLEMEYFKLREQQEQEFEKTKENFLKEVEEETEKAVNDILKSLNFN